MGATEKTCCYSYLGLFMFSHIWVLFPSVWLIVGWNRFLRCWESFTHTMPKWFKSPLQLEVSCQQFSKHLFYNGGLWGKCFLDRRRIFCCITMSGHHAFGIKADTLRGLDVIWCNLVSFNLTNLRISQAKPWNCIKLYKFDKCPVLENWKWHFSILANRGSQ